VRSTTPITFRRYAPADADFVRAVADEAFSEYDGGGGRSGTHALTVANATRTHTLVAERANRPVGFVMLVVASGTAHVSAIAVVRTARGQGIGARLLHAAEQLARTLGARVVALETGEANLAALDMFLRAGYRIDGRIARYYTTGYDALTLRRDLS
jgi:ribosomal protein S18 acetylase RimI-like enzyme